MTYPQNPLPVHQQGAHVLKAEARVQLLYYLATVPIEGNHPILPTGPDDIALLSHS
jgi:hypothetical protein